MKMTIKTTKEPRGAATTNRSGMKPAIDEEATHTSAKWTELATNLFPPSELVTPWFPEGVQPVRTGWYERFFKSDVHLQHWDGKQWLWDKHLPYAKSLGNPLRPCWRGLLRPSTEPS